VSRRIDPSARVVLVLVGDLFAFEMYDPKNELPDVLDVCVVRSREQLRADCAFCARRGRRRGGARHRRRARLEERLLEPRRRGARQGRPMPEKPRFPAVEKDPSFKVTVHYENGRVLEFRCAGRGADEAEVVFLNGGGKIDAQIKVPIEALSTAVELLKHEACYVAKRDGARRG
jgi:hypothetical protein